MLRGERGPPVSNESVEVGIVPQRQAGHQGAVRGKTSFLQVLNGPEKFVRFTRMFIPPDMLQGRDADDQIVLLLRGKLDDVLAHNTRSDFVLVDDVMVNRIIVGEDVAEFENTLVLISHQKFAENRDFHSALVFPGLIVHVVQVLVSLAVEMERFSSHEAGQRHLDGAPISPSDPLIGCRLCVIVGIGQGQRPSEVTRRRCGSQGISS